MKCKYCNKEITENIRLFQQFCNKDCMEQYLND